jgi:GTPase-associated system helical domain
VNERPALEKIRDLCPVLGAVSASLTTEGGEEWHAAYRKTYGLDPKLKIGAVDLAHQTYREWMLARAADRE